MARCRAQCCVLSSALVAALVVLTPAARADVPAQDVVVSAVPTTTTPAVNDGEVQAAARVGSTIVIGGTFDSVTSHGSTAASPRPDIAAFNQATGILTDFAPTLNGSVDALAPGPVSGTVYAAGTFTSVDGVAESIALLHVSTGSVVAGWSARSFDAKVTHIALVDGHLIVAGYFKHAGDLTRRGMAALDPRTGTLLSSYSTPAFAGHHNYTGAANQAAGIVGIASFAVNPDGRQIMAIGNFTRVSGATHDQVARLTVSRKGIEVDSSWSTLSYSAACDGAHFDSYVRGIDYAPSGSYFVIVSTGGEGTNTDGTKGQCDSAARYSATATGRNVHAQWVDYTGDDSMYSVACTGAVIYVGGHQRWLNNSFGSDVAGTGSVPRPGLAALDPRNGLPLAWNPGRDPRGEGVFVLLPTSNGLYVGSDTDYIGNSAYLRPRLAEFPLAGGTVPAADATGNVPGTVCLVGGTGGGSSITCRSYNGHSKAGAARTVAGLDGAAVHGAFEIHGNLYYGLADGFLHERSFTGRTLGGPVTLDPYDDPRWSSVQTGSGQTYRGVSSTLAAELPHVTSMVYRSGKLFYTRSDRTHMYWRWFEPDSGVVGADEHAVDSPHGWAAVRGGFGAGSTYYFYDMTRHRWRSIAFTANGPSGAESAHRPPGHWSSRGAFALTPVAAGRPGAPSLYGVTAANASARVDVMAPTDATTASIRTYTVSAIDLTDAARGGQSVVALAGSVIVGGLANGDHYRFIVTAANAVGPGKASAPSPTVTPQAPPTG